MNEVTKQKGQTVIETALMMILILVLFFGIAEIARAWYLKNSLSNAARVGVRVAIVEAITPDTQTKPASPPSDCSGLTGNDKVFCAVWNTSGLPADATAIIDITNDVSPSGASPGDTVQVTVTGTFTTVVPGLASMAQGLIPGETGSLLQAQAVMRHE